MSLPLALTLGEPAGIGPDLTLAIWQRRRELTPPPFYVLGDAEFLRARAKTLGLSINLKEVTAAETAHVFADALPVGGTAHVTARPGQPDDRSAPPVLGAIRAGPAA